MKTACRRLTAALSALTLLLTLAACKNKDTAEIHAIDFQPAPAYEAEYISLPVPTGDLIGCCTDGEYMYILADEKTGDEVRSVLCRVSLPDGTVTELVDYQAPKPMESAVTTRLGPVLAPDGSLWVYERWTMVNYDLPEDFDPERESKSKYYTGRDDFHHLRQLDPVTGREKKLADISSAIRELDVSDLFGVSGFMVDDKENIYVSGTGGAAVLDKEGGLLFTLQASLPYSALSNTNGGALALLPDGSAAALTVLPSGKREVRAIDASAGNWGADSYELPAGVDRIYSGTNGFLFYYVTGGVLQAWEPEETEGRMLLSWPTADLDGTVMCFAPQDGNKLAVLTLAQNGAFGDDDYWYNADIRLTMLFPADKPVPDGKIRLVYGTIGEDSAMRYRINAFNRQHDDCYIEICNYAGPGVELFYDADRAAAQDAALKLLSAEVVSGSGPDIWDKSLPIDLYARKGALEDLWPWIDGDDELGRENLMSHVLDCMSVDGKLYKAANTFAIVTLVARSDVVGDRTSWTLEELLDYYAALPEGATIMEPDWKGRVLLRQLLLKDVGRWVNWSDGTCSFDSDSFKAVLELCGRITGEEDVLSGTDEQIGLQEGRQLAVQAWLYGRDDLLYYDALCAGPEHVTDYVSYLNENNIYSALLEEEGNWRDKDTVTICPALSDARDARELGKLSGAYPIAADAAIGTLEGGGYAAYVGYPVEEGSGNSFWLNQPVGMSASCRNKDAAWEYIRQCLLPSGTATVEDSNGTTFSTVGFPINKEAFDRYMAFEPEWFVRDDGEYLLDQDGNRIEKPGDHMIPVPAGYGDGLSTMVIFDMALNETQIGRFMELYNSIGPSQSADSELAGMIDEQAAAYFAGDKSLDETVDLIQRRVTLYVNENR